MSVGTGFARRGSRCVYACSLSPAGKTQSTFSNICHPLGVFFLFPMCVFRLREASGKVAGTFFFFFSFAACVKVPQSGISCRLRRGEARWELIKRAGGGGDKKNKPHHTNVQR